MATAALGDPFHAAVMFGLPELMAQRSCDLVARAVRRYADDIALAKSDHRSPLVLKSPAMMIDESAWLEAFQVNLVIEISRKFEDVMSSWATLLTEVGVLLGRSSTEEVGRVVDCWDVIWSQVSRRVRSNSAADQYLGLHFEDLVRDPVRVAIEIAERLGVTPDVQRLHRTVHWLNWLRSGHNRPRGLRL